MSFDIFAGSDLACECMDTHGCGMAGVMFSECEAHGIKTEKMEKYKIFQIFSKNFKKMRSNA